MTTRDFKSLFQLRDSILHASYDLRINSAMWERAWQASFRSYGSRIEYESAVHATAKALRHYQIVLLYKFWEKRKKASLPVFAKRARAYQSALVDHIAAQQLILTPSHASEFREKRARQFARLIAAIDCSEKRFKSLIEKLSRARNDVIAHNIFADSERIAMDTLEFRSLSSRTVRLCICLILAFDGPTQNTNLAFSKRTRVAVDAFWTRIEGERSKRFR